MKQIIAAGGGGFSTGKKNYFLDLYILSQSKSKKPKICFLPTASGDNYGYIKMFYETFSNYPCDPKHLCLINPNISDFHSFLLEQDIIYVGGGNTKTMLAIWREWGIDKILKEALENNVILSGISAGSVCWFKQCITDSIPNHYSVLDCLGFLNYSNCPHYNSDENRRPEYHRYLQEKLIIDGYACDDNVAIHFVDQDIKNIVSANKNANAYKLYIDEDDKVRENILTTNYLKYNTELQKYICDNYNNFGIGK